jgi:hypothetical protein
VNTSIREEDILKALRERPGGQATYVIKNILNGGRGGRGDGTPMVSTVQVRRQLEKMERAGKAPSIYARHICWAPAEEVPT